MSARILKIESPKVPYQIQSGSIDAPSSKQHCLRQMTDTALLTQTKNLVQMEREILTDVLLHLAEIQKRKAFSPRFQSLADYAIRELGYSEDEAARRISAMKLLKELPEIEGAISDGSLKLSTLNLARTHFRNEAKQSVDQKLQELTRESKIELLTKLKGKTAREATRTLIEESSAPEKLTHFESVKPISSTMNEIKILADDETLKKIARLKGLLAHKHPHLTNGELVSIALDMALAQLDPTRGPKRKSSPLLAEANPGKTATSRFSKPDNAPAVDTKVNGTEIFNAQPVDAAKTNGTGISQKKPTALDVPSPPKRYVPQQINRELWRESEGKCALCGSTHALERDHIRPFALGGETSKDNLRLLCRNCNQRQGIKTFGRRDP